MGGGLDGGGGIQMQYARHIHENKQIRMTNYILIIK